MTAIPMALMLSVSTWALGTIFLKSVTAGDCIRAGASLFLLVLAGVVIGFAILALRNTRKE